MGYQSDLLEGRFAAWLKPRPSEVETQSELLVAEGLHGVDAGGAAGRAVGCCYGDREEDQGGADEGGGVGGLESVEHGADEASEGECGCEASCDADDSEP